MKVRDLFNQTKDHRQARREMASFLRSQAREDSSLTLLERGQVHFVAASPFMLDVLLARTADLADAQGVEVDPNNWIDFMKRFWTEVWPEIVAGIKSLLGAL